MPLFVFAEIDLETVSVRIGRGNLRKRSVAFCCKGNILDFCAINRDADFVFGLIERICARIVSIRFVDLDIDLMDITRVEKTGLVFLRFGFCVIGKRISPKLAA